MSCNYWTWCTWKLCSVTREATTLRSLHTGSLQLKKLVCSNKEPAQSKINKNFKYTIHWFLVYSQRLQPSTQSLLEHFHHSFFFYIFFFIVVVFVIHWHESAMDLHVFPIPIPPPTSLSTRSLWVFPVHQVWALVSCIQPGLVICFTLDNIHV